MFGSELIEVAIGLVFVFIIVSTMCSAVREGIESILKTRAAYLEHGIRALLHDPEGSGLAKALYEHPLVYSLFLGDYKPGSKATGSPSMVARGKNLPTYIPSKNFAMALLDLASRGLKTNLVNSDPSSPIVSLDQIRANVLQLDNERVQRVLLAAIDSAQGDLNRAQKNIEAWFDSAMDRVSGWYKRSTGWILFAIALAMAVAANVDTITIADYLYRNNAVRAQIVVEAENLKEIPKNDFQTVNKELANLQLPIGWPRPTPAYPPVTALAGWLLTALAASLGAPFWFDVLNKIIVIRSTVKPHEKSPEESSEDRQTEKSKTPTVIVAGGTASTNELPQAPPVAPHPPPPPTPAEDLIDGCNVRADASTATSDEDLPQAEGGVA